MAEATQTRTLRAVRHDIRKILREADAPHGIYEPLQGRVGVRKEENNDNFKAVAASLEDPAAAVAKSAEARATRYQARIDQLKAELADLEQQVENLSAGDPERVQKLEDAKAAVLPLVEEGLAIIADRDEETYFAAKHRGW